MDPDGDGGDFPYPNQAYDANPIDAALSLVNRSSLSQVNRSEEGSSSSSYSSSPSSTFRHGGGSNSSDYSTSEWGASSADDASSRLANRSSLSQVNRSSNCPTLWVAHPMATTSHGTSLSCFACPLTQPDQALDIFTLQLMNVSTKNPSSPSSTMRDKLSMFFHAQTSMFSFGPT